MQVISGGHDFPRACKDTNKILNNCKFYKILAREFIGRNILNTSIHTLAKIRPKYDHKHMFETKWSFIVKVEPDGLVGPVTPPTLAALC